MAFWLCLLGKVGFNSGHHDMEDQEKSSGGFVRTTLPWAIFGGALLLYLLTLNHWVTLTSLPVVAKITGWDPIPPAQGPLFYLLTYPFRWLSGNTQLLALNGFSAVCGALALALLARSVMLLPHDRTRDQRQRERGDHALLSIPTAWIPAALAALVAGLQLTFWEHSTVATGEMLDLLVFAYCVRCVLEYRVSQRESWLIRMAFVYGLGITNNWAMIAFFPCFVVALIWIKGVGFFNFGFITKMAGCGLAGLSLYLVLPLVAISTDTAHSSFWELLRQHLGGQKSILFGFPRGRVLMLALTSLVPVLFMGIRWPSTVGDTSAAGAIITHWMFRLAHLLFLAACAFVAFDPAFSPRALGYGSPFLPFYFLGALSIGYYSAYFLLLATEPAGKTRHRTSALDKIFGLAMRGVVWLALIGLPVGLAYQNFQRIQTSKDTSLKEYATMLKESVTGKSPIIISDNGLDLLLLRAVETGSKTIQINSRVLPYHPYLRILKQQYGSQLADIDILLKDTNPVADNNLVEFVIRLAASNDVHYLQPSFGFFFEAVYQHPQGAAQRIIPYAPQSIEPPAMSPAAIQANLAFWQKWNPTLQHLAEKVKKEDSYGIMLGSWLSRRINQFGLELQYAERLTEAEKAFSQALELNPKNVSALINRKNNLSLQKQTPVATTLSDSEKEMIRDYRNWDELLNINGGVDDPTVSFTVGQQFAQSGNYRQAVVQFMRAKRLEPDNLQSSFWLVNAFVAANVLDSAVKEISYIRNHRLAGSMSLANQIELIKLEAMIAFGKNNFDQAEQILQTALKRHPDQQQLLDSLFFINFRSMRLPQALAITERQLQTDPNRNDALLNNAAIHIELKQYDKALPALEKLLQIQPDHKAALMNRAIANLQSGKYDAAERDYRALSEKLSASHVLYYGLGEIAYQKKDTATAIKNYELYLKNAPEGTLEISKVQKRLEELKGQKTAN